MSKVSYVAYIDESGDDGITRVKPIDTDGASEWFVLSAVVVRAERGEEVSWVRDILSNLELPQRKDLHFSPLDDRRRTRVCEAIATLPLRCFVVMCNKRNMRGYVNPRAAKVYSPARNWFYWWSTRLLLERVTDYCEHRSVRDHGEPRTVPFEFSRRGGLSYSHFKAYLHWLRMQSRGDNLVLDQGDLKWSVVDVDQVFAFDHKQRAGLQLADAVAAAFFQAVHLGTKGASEPKYAMTLKPRVACRPDASVYGYGVKLMPGGYIYRAQPHQRDILRFYQKGRRAPGP